MPKLGPAICVAAFLVASVVFVLHGHLYFGGWCLIGALGSIP